MGYDLQLKKGGILITKDWDPDADDFVEKRLEMEDLSFRLHDTICLENGVTLRDVFMLIVKSSYILSISTCCPFIDDLAEEALTVPKLNEENSDFAALRLKWRAMIDHDGDGKFFHCHVDFHGIGRKKKQHSIQFSPINELAMYPVILDEEFIITDGDNDDVLLQTTRKFSLTEMLFGIINELAYMGPPDIKNFALQALKAHAGPDVEICTSEDIDLSVEDFADDKKPCRICGEEARAPFFGKPSDMCRNCFKKTKEN